MESVRKRNQESPTKNFARQTTKINDERTASILLTLVVMREVTSDYLINTLPFWSGGVTEIASLLFCCEYSNTASCRYGSQLEDHGATVLIRTAVLMMLDDDDER